MHTWLIRAKKFLFLILRPRFMGLALRGACPSIELLPLVRAIATPIGTVLDVGANRGQFALLARRAFPQARIYSFEPLTNTRTRDFIADDHAVEWVECALADHDGEETFYVATASDNSSLLAPRHAKVERTMRIRCARFDSLAASFDLLSPVLLKIDVQGAELQVLDGFGDMLDVVDWLLIEVSFAGFYERQALADQVMSYLMERGFAVASLLNGRLVSGQPGQADILFRRQPDPRSDARRDAS